VSCLLLYNVEAVPAFSFSSPPHSNTKHLLEEVQSTFIAINTNTNTNIISSDIKTSPALTRCDEPITMPHLTQIPTTLHSTDHEFTSLLRILEEYAHRKHAAPFVPRFDLEEHETTYELYGEFPGVKPNDITVSAINDHSLEIRGVIKPRSAPGIETEEVESVEHSITVQHPHGIPAPATPVEPPKSEQSARGAEEGALSGPAKPAEEKLAEKAQHPLEPREEELRFPRRRAMYEDILLQPELAPKPSEPLEMIEDVLCRSAVQKPVEEKKEAEKDKETVKVIISERQTGEFHRVFHFPTPVELGEGVKARMDNGVLHVSIPRGPTPPPPKPVQVDVSWIPYYGL